MRLSALARFRALATTLTVAGLLASAGCSADSKTTPTSPGTGALAVTVNGLPSGASASVVVSGPGTFSQTLTHSTTLSDLAPGTYQLAASAVASHDTSYAPSPTAATLAVAADAAPAAATVVYARSSTGSTTLDLSIGAMYLTQSTQTLAGTVPLVQNRDGYLRVFVLANQANSVTPAVRVRFYVNGALQGSPTIIAAPSHAVPTSIAEGTLASSWNVSVPGSMIKPGLAILADVDPDAGNRRGATRQQQLPRVGNAARADGEEPLHLLPSLRAREAERQRSHGRRLERQQGCASHADREDPSDLELQRGRARDVHHERARAHGQQLPTAPGQLSLAKSSRCAPRREASATTSES